MGGTQNKSLPYLSGTETESRIQTYKFSKARTTFTSAETSNQICVMCEVRLVPDRRQLIFGSLTEAGLMLSRPSKVGGFYYWPAIAKETQESLS